MADQDRVGSIADASKPNAGRIYDYVLGGNHNFEVDRQTAQEIIRLMPDYPEQARYVRWFLGEAVRRLASEGFRQFIDFASGLPTVDHIHHITPAGTKVIYSDIDPVTVAYGQEIIREVPYARYVVCDAAEPENLLNSPIVAEFFGINRKVAFGFNGIVFFLKDEQISHIMRTLYDWAEKGSRLFICDLDLDPSQQIPELAGMFSKMGQPVFWRRTNELRKLVQPWSEGAGFKSLDEWVGIRMPQELKKSIYSDTLRGAILEK